ncbi:GH116 family glycosyl-hydrolase [Posidoniimonas corsicana]|uniref:GH116 family glycosyl-hydrolase n=1 Tax=Posidoniimonas corsicana TaxID=1938618 RepID=UPI0018D41100|nr:GH116 family glycosyl-hydrolase [Posidoniimonas corsicana]
MAADPAELYRELIPEDKRLDPTWIESLTERGHALDRGISGSKKDNTLKYIGMPVGGIACGTLIMDGAGQLYSWDIFRGRPLGVVKQEIPLPEGYQGFRNGRIKKMRPLDGANYMNPPTFDQFAPPVQQGFKLTVDGERAFLIGPQDWETVEFTGRWPLGTVRYADPDCPVEVQLDAYSPFIPLHVEDSKLPATILCFSLTNPTSESHTIVLEGWLGKDAKDVASHPIDRSEFTAVVLEFADASQKKRRGSLGLGVLDTAKAFTQDNVSGLRVSIDLAPGASRAVPLFIAWHFGHHAYTHRFDTATDVIGYIARSYLRLSSDTHSWVNTWSDTTLPHWFMDRSMASASTMQTANLQFAGDRFWAWEGIGAGAGTCTHVWGYAQTMARLFPSLERNLREKTDFGLYQLPDGGVPFRPSKDKQKVAIDGQCGIVLRSYREHLCSVDDAFLARNWPSIKKAVEYLIAFDKSDDAYDGLLDGQQHNTLDAEWRRPQGY